MNVDREVAELVGLSPAPRILTKISANNTLENDGTLERNERQLFSYPKSVHSQGSTDLK